jgi:hypothetical protein
MVPVQHTEGLVHGFLVLRSLDGNILADGDLNQVAHGDRVTYHLVFHFKDDSINDETMVFSQRRKFRLLSYHLLQKGPAFPRLMDLSIKCSTGEVTVRTTDDDGKERVEASRLKLPVDISNGLVLILMKNLSPDSPKTTVSMLAATPKPRLVKLEITSQGEDSFLVAGTKRTATKYAVKVDIGGVAGLVAPLLGKQPPDTHIWVLGGEAPAFVKSEGPLFLDGPIWRIELTSPEWPEADSKDAKQK